MKRDDPFGLIPFGLIEVDPRELASAIERDRARPEHVPDDESEDECSARTVREEMQAKGYAPMPRTLPVPACGWEQAFKRLIVLGRCPWCHSPARLPDVNMQHGLTWACYEGCNP